MSGIRLPGPPEHRFTGFRRVLISAVGLTIFAAVAVTVRAGQTGKPTHPKDITLLYVGAEDCAPCRAWQNHERTTFLASADFPLIAYQEVKSPHLHDILKDENWPDDIRDYRAGLKRSDGVPLWLVVVDRKVVEQRFGAAEWRASVLPAIKSLLR